MSWVCGQPNTENYPSSSKAVMSKKLHVWTTSSNLCSAIGWSYSRLLHHHTNTQPCTLGFHVFHIGVSLGENLNKATLLVLLNVDSGLVPNMYSEGTLLEIQDVAMVWMVSRLYWQRLWWESCCSVWFHSPVHLPVSLSLVPVGQIVTVDQCSQ